jgi:hypothetical protein
MGFYAAQTTGWRCAVAVLGFLGLFNVCHPREARGQASASGAHARAEGCVVRDLHSRHFLLHTDLSLAEANGLVERLEAMLVPMAAYWGQPLKGVIECYVIRNLDEFPATAIAPAGVHAVRTFGGATLMQVTREGKRQAAKSLVCSSERLEVLQHEVVHAYCHQTFGRLGPVWYSEGMAEMGRFWTAGDIAVHAQPREIEFLRSHALKSLAETLSPAQYTGDSWQNYASRWALCHFLSCNPNYSRQFRQLGRGILAGRDVSFERTYAATMRQLSFEYLFFLQHIGRGYRVESCAWNWKKRFARLQPGQPQSVTVAAGRGWQPAGLAARSRTRYQYLAAGTWQVAGAAVAVNPNGDRKGCGRLVGALMNDYRLGPEFELGAEGSLRSQTGGDLYLRCRSPWNELADDRGRVTVTFRLAGD